METKVYTFVDSPYSTLGFFGSFTMPWLRILIYVDIVLYLLMNLVKWKSSVIQRGWTNGFNRENVVDRLEAMILTR